MSYIANHITYKYSADGPEVLKDVHFTIEQGMPNEDNVLCGVDADGKREELQTAPPTGSEISAVLELVREDREEAQEQ